MKLKEVLSNAGKWTQGHYAVDDKNETISSLSDGAAKFCLIGAIRKACGDDWEKAIKVAHSNAVKLGFIDKEITEPFSSLINFNDNPETTWEKIKEVVELTDKDITNEAK